MYESLRYNDYSVENGLGEIVDNSVEAGAREIRIDFTKKTEKVGKKKIEEIQRITVADNGIGVSILVMVEIMRLGKERLIKMRGCQFLELIEKFYMIRFHI